MQRAASDRGRKKEKRRIKTAGLQLFAAYFRLIVRKEGDPIEKQDGGRNGEASAGAL